MSAQVSTGSASGDDAGNPATPVRDEDAFDAAAMAAWLRENAETLPPGWTEEDLAGTPEVRQFPGGASNLTYLLRYQHGDLILRRPPSGVKAAGAHDMGREFGVQRALAPVFAYVATMVAHCTDESVIGSDFYVMEKVEGTIPRKDLPFTLSEDDAGRLCRNAFDVLISLHQVDVDQVPELAAMSKGEGYVERQMSGWTRRFADARTEDTGDWSDIIAWLEAHQPDDVAQRLIHNDFRFDNLVLDAEDPMRIVGVLDWEMATVGDPLMDLGGVLSYWVEAGDDEFFQAFRRQPTTEPGMWTRQQVVDHYCKQMGLEMTPQRWRFYEVFGLFRLAVIAQQIWYRYFHGQTTNEAVRRLRAGGGLPGDPLPLADLRRKRSRSLMGQVLLVRHGQASFGADDYDVLSEVGWTQGRRLGESLAARGTRPTSLVRGDMRRHRETVQSMSDGAAWEATDVEVDPGWDEFDHVGIVASYPDRRRGSSRTTWTGVPSSGSSRPPRLGGRPGSTTATRSRTPTSWPASAPRSAGPARRPGRGGPWWWSARADRSRWSARIWPTRRPTPRRRHGCGPGSTPSWSTPA